jgi:hypothetical protein
MAGYNDINKYSPLRKAVNMAAMDAHKDIGVVERSYSHWAARGLKEFTRETLRTGKRQSILHVNPATNTAFLPCDFEEDLFVGYVNDCGEKYPLRLNSKLVNDVAIEEVPCEDACEAHCDCCFPKQLCNDLTTTQEIKLIDINGTDYEQTITSTLQDNGEYYVVTTTPYFNMITSEVEYRTDKKFVTKFDLAACGCLQDTPANRENLKSCNYDCYCCYCTPCHSACSDYVGGYRIFKESGYIKFDAGMKLDRVYLEWTGSIPKINGEYVIPDIALESLASFIVFKDGEHNKSVPLWEKRWRYDRFIENCKKMEIDLGRMKLSTIIDALMLTPKVGFHTE